MCTSPREPSSPIGRLTAILIVGIANILIAIPLLFVAALLAIGSAYTWAVNYLEQRS